MRKNVIAANWKMNTLPKEGVEIANKINHYLADKELPVNKKIVLGVPYTHLIKVVDTETESCFVAKEYPGLKCGNNGGDCSIYDLAVTKGDCTSDSTYVLVVNFKTHNP